MIIAIVIIRYELDIEGKVEKCGNVNNLKNYAKSVTFREGLSSDINVCVFLSQHPLGIYHKMDQISSIFILNVFRT